MYGRQEKELVSKDRLSKVHRGQPGAKHERVPADGSTVGLHRSILVGDVHLWGQA